MLDRGPLPLREALIFVVVALCLTLPRLGDRLYWGDEREDFNFIYRILEYGIPDMTGGHTDGGPDDVGSQVNKDHLHNYHPWLPLYQTTLSVKLFGWADRFMFRIWGVLWFVLSVPVVWRLARQMGLEGRMTTSLYVLSPLALVPARAARYYGAVLFFAPLVILDYLKTRQGSRWAPWRLGLWMALLFHHNTMSAGALGCGLLLHWLVTGRGTFKALLLSVAVCAGPIYWWLFPMGALEVGGMLDLRAVPMRGLKAIWLMLVTTLPAPLLLALWRRRDTHRDILCLLLCVLIPLFTLVSSAVLVTPNLRYFLPWLACGTIALGIWLEDLAPQKARVLFVLLAATNIVQLVPLGLVNLVPSERLVAYGRSSSDAAHFVRATATPRFLLFDHVSELSGGYVGPGASLQELFIQAGYKIGEAVHVLSTDRDQLAQDQHLVTEALFDLNKGLPGEMLEGFPAPLSLARWCVTAGPELEPGDQFEMVAEDDNLPGFWIEGPNPFNRRYRTLRGGTLKLWRRR